MTSKLSYYIRDNPDDLVNPVEYIKTFRSYCPLEQEKCFCCEQGENLKFARFSNTYKEGNLYLLPTFPAQNRDLEQI